MNAEPSPLHSANPRRLADYLMPAACLLFASCCCLAAVLVALALDGLPRSSSAATLIWCVMGCFSWLAAYWAAKHDRIYDFELAFGSSALVVICWTL
jgi:hypothetical protein